jgi:pyruvate dehydrogenase phosphatase
MKTTFFRNGTRVGHTLNSFKSGVRRNSTIPTSKILSTSIGAVFLGGLGTYFFTRDSKQPQSKLEPKLSPNEITRRITALQTSISVDSVVQKIDVNQLASNDPMEDYFDIAVDENGRRFYLGVYDGHGGWECATLVQQYLSSYVAYEVNSVVGSSTSDGLSFPELKRRRAVVEDAITRAFVRLDGDLLSGAIVLPDSLEDSPVKHQTRSSFAGACGIFALVDGNDLYVACTGDSRAVVGRRLLDDRFVAIPMSQDQSAKNPDELRRLLQGHPGEEYTVVTRGRVLGNLMPTRAFGDSRYKYTLDIHKTLIPVCHARGAPKNYHTPPYVTAKPVVTHRQLDQHDKFIILATDGLWDTMSSEEAVEMVGDLSVSANAPVHKRLPSLPAPQFYAREDKNCATHLIRNSLGGSDQWHVSELLSIEAPYSRRHRDDITIVVAQLDLQCRDKAHGLRVVHLSEGGPKGDGRLHRWLEQAVAERVALDLERQLLSEQPQSRPGDVIGG